MAKDPAARPSASQVAQVLEHLWQQVLRDEPVVAEEKGSRREFKRPQPRFASVTSQPTKKFAPGSGVPLTKPQLHSTVQDLKSGVSLTASQTGTAKQGIGSGVPLTTSQMRPMEQGVHSGMPLIESPKGPTDQKVDSGLPLTVSQTSTTGQDVHSGV